MLKERERGPSPELGRSERQVQLGRQITTGCHESRSLLTVDVKLLQLPQDSDCVLNQKSVFPKLGMSGSSLVNKSSMLQTVLRLVRFS